MAFGTTQADNASTPVSSVYVPGTASSDLTALEGYAPINTDGNSQKSAPASMGIKDGNNATFGAKADSSATSDTGTFSFIALFKRLLQKFPAIGQQTKTASLSVTLASDDGNIGAPGDTSATSDTGTFSLIALFKRLLQGITTSNTNTSNTATNTSTVAGAVSSSKMATKASSGDFADGAIASIGAQADTAASSDTGTFSLIALFKRLLQGITTSNTNTSNTATNTSTVAGAISSSKMATKAASGDFADGAMVGIGTTTQTKATDATTTSWSVIQLLKGIFNSLLGVLLVSRSTVAVYSLASTTTSGSTQNSGDITVGPYTEISIDINTTAQAGTSPTIQYFYERKGADGIYYPLWQSAVFTAAANTVSTSVGAGMAINHSLGLTGRLRWVVGGTATPTFTHTLNVYGR